MATLQKLIYDPYDGEYAEKLTIKSMKLLNDDYGNLKYIIYLLEKKLNDGSIVEFYKATSFFRLLRVSKESKENKKFMDIHTDIVRAMYINDISIIQVIANILEPTPEGIMFLYGVQSTGNTLEEAVKKCAGDFNAFMRSFQGTHRTAHIGPISKETMNWIFKKLQKQTYSAVLKGIPAVRYGSGDNRNIIKNDSSTEEQLEQFLIGATSMEFIMMMMATPISKNYLRTWLKKSLDEESKWQSQKQGSNSLSLGISIPMTISCNNSNGTSLSAGTGTSAGTSVGETGGTSDSTSSSTSISDGGSSSTGVSDSVGSSYSNSNGASSGESASSSDSSSDTWGASAGLFGAVQGSYSSGSSSSSSAGTSSGTSYTETNGQSTTSGTSQTDGTSWSEGTTTGTTSGSSSGWSSSSNSGTSTSNSQGVTNSYSQGLSGGLAPSMSIGKTYQWMDMTVAYICELLGMQNSRLKAMTDGDGGFFSDFYLSTDSDENLQALRSLAAVTWVNPDSKIDILRVEVPEPIDQKKLVLHMQAMSPCLDIEFNKRNRNGFYYKFSSILRSTELSSYSHPPRVSVGGLDNSMEDRPLMRIPTDRQSKEIFVGHVVSGERFNYEQACKNRGLGYSTDFKYSIGNDEMSHCFISGQAGSGKSVLATRLVTELYQKTYTIDSKGKKRKKRILVLDPKGEWRGLAYLVPCGKFKFYSLGKTNFYPLKMNLLRVPKYVAAYKYYNMIIEHFCSAYGLMDRAIAQIGGVIYKLYEENEVFNNVGDPFWANEHSKNITFADVYAEIEKLMEKAQATRNNHDAEALQTYLTRLDMYNRSHSNEYIMFCNKGGDSADTVLGDDDVTVIESAGLSDNAQKFFFVLLMDSIFQNALAQGSTGFYKNSYETIIVLEEANTVLISAGKDDTAGQKSINRINQLIDQSRSLGLFIFTITQKIASMPESVIANSSLIFIGRNTQETDIKVALSSLGYDTMMRDLDIKKFIPRMPVGEFIAKISRGEKEIDQTPTCVKVSQLKFIVPDDNELDIILRENDLKRMTA